VLRSICNCAIYFVDKRSVKISYNVMFFEFACVLNNPFKYSKAYFGLQFI